MPTLAEKREELLAKQQALAVIFEQAGPEIDFMKVENMDGDSKARAEKVRSLNDELTAIGKEVEELQGWDTMRTANSAAVASMNRPAGTVVHQTPGARLDEMKNLEQRIVESPVITAYQKVGRSSPVIEISAPELFARQSSLATKNTLLTETGYAPQAVRMDLIVPGALRRPVVADLIPQGTTDQIAIVYMEETTTTNAAAAVAEGNAKPESALAFTERSSPVRKIATVLPVTDELINDVPAMQSYLEARLRLFLQLAEETALLSGAGSPDLTGILNTSGIQTQAKGADPTPDAFYKAIVKILTTAFLPPDGMVVHPLDWQDIRLLRTSDGIYIWGAPMDPGPERMWGLPAVVTTAMTQNTGLVGAFGTAAQIFRRSEVAFAISTENEDFFIKNKLMLRVEERLAMPVYRPSAFCTVTGI